MGQHIDLVIQIGIVAFLLFLGLFFGRRAERLHFQSLEEREVLHRDFLVTQLRSFPQCDHRGQPPVLLCGEAVVSSDFLKSFLTKLRKIFGGELRSYRSLLERARREALLRIVEQAESLGYDAVCNVRYYTADIAGTAKMARSSIDMVSILATATAYRRMQSPA